jgi:hypothetical protein
VYAAAASDVAFTTAVIGDYCPGAATTLILVGVSASRCCASQAEPVAGNHSRVDLPNGRMAGGRRRNLWLRRCP